MRIFLLFSFCLITTHLSVGQDLLFDVKIDASSANTSDNRVITDIQTSFQQFLNDRNWIDEDLETYERIKAVMAINIINIPKAGQYDAKMQVQAVRPIYGSTYESIMWNAPDVNFSFAFAESQPLDYAVNSRNSHLESILAFYANLLIGLDMDSYSPLGGQEYLDEAFNIARAAQQQNIGTGWDQFGNIESRFAVIQSILNVQLEPLRKANYTYHREGLDKMSENPPEARENILSVIETIQRINKLNPNEPFIQLWVQAKAEEIVNIFEEGEISQRRKAYNLMREIAPANSERYEPMIK
jgi:hypothetical protein